jgi:hypothetical protein
MHTKKAVTGQQIDESLAVENIDCLPSESKGVEFLNALQGDIMGPHEVLGDGRPKWNGEVFFERRAGPKSSVTYLLDGENLERQVPKCAGTNIHLETIAAGGFSLVVDGLDVPSTAVSGITTEPHLNKRRNP